MYGYLKGVLLAVNRDRIILETGGVGYEILIGQKWLAENESKIGQNFAFFIHTAARDNDITLIGFSNLADKQMFERLLKVSSVGPKTALLVISEKTAAEIERAVETQDIDFFLNIKGLAKKTAQKIIIELRSQFKALAKEKDQKLQESAVELSAALKTMGFSPQEIKTVLTQTNASLSLEDQVKQALQKLHS